MTFEEWYDLEIDGSDYDKKITKAAWDAAYAEAGAEFMSSYKEAIAEVRESYVLVPKEPTEEIKGAFIDTYLSGDTSFGEIYKAMIQAAQEEE